MKGTNQGYEGHAPRASALVTVSPVLGSPAISIISLLAAAEHTAFYGTMSILTRTMSMDVRENE